MTLEEKETIIEHLRFSAWECLSLVKQDLTTLDLVFKDSSQLMVVLRVLSRLVHGQECEQSYLKLY